MADVSESVAKTAVRIMARAYEAAMVANGLSDEIVEKVREDAQRMVESLD